MKAINDYINYQYPEEPDRCYFECLENRLFRKVTDETGSELNRTLAVKRAERALI